MLELKWGQNKTNKECFKKECENIKYVKNKLVIRMIVFVFKIQWNTLECENDHPEEKWTAGHKQFVGLFGTTEFMCSVLRWLNPAKKGRAQISHLIVSTVSVCCCICFVSKCQYYVKLAVTEFCQISSVWGFHRCLCPWILMQIFFLVLNNQKSMELMQYYNPGFSVPLTLILKTVFLKLIYLWWHQCI